MSFTSRRAYFALMILGALALLVDRVIWPADVAGSELLLAPSDGPADTAGAGETDRAGLPIPALPFPRDLERFIPEGRIPDIFARPSTSVVQTSTDVERAAESPAAGTLDRASFAERHHLMGVLTKGRVKVAVVQGRWLREGESLDGCKLTRIDARTATFECFDGSAVLPFGPESSASRERP